MDHTVEYLKECFDLNPVTFKLSWRTRPEHHFAHSRSQSRFNTMYAGKIAGFEYEEVKSGLKYIKVKFHNKGIVAHRIIWALVKGEIPEYDIDHIDGNGLNNNPENLRLCDEFINSRNKRKHKNNTSGVTGVTWRAERNKWLAQGRIYKGKDFVNTYLGMFDNIEDAAKVRKQWEEDNNFSDRHGI